MQGSDKIQKTLSRHSAEIRAKFPVKSLAVFGSVARGSARSDSDIDILVEFSRPVGIEFIDLGNYLESLLNLRVDLVSQRGMKPMYFEQIKNQLLYV